MDGTLILTPEIGNIPDAQFQPVDQVMTIALSGLSGPRGDRGEKGERGEPAIAGDIADAPDFELIFDNKII